MILNIFLICVQCVITLIFKNYKYHDICDLAVTMSDFVVDKFIYISLFIDGYQSYHFFS